MAAEHAHDAHDYHRGEMDIHEQAATYSLFGKLTKWGSLITAVAILWLTLWFCTSAGFLGSTVTSIVALVIGIWVLRERKGAH
ncbi:MAG TPA: aa3-type cytochrome c oxidase subunit IV [Caulobacteraceae bacterium]|nr:aa3-type cytochrome c oxidase subunit IV [Caulobacteraceae bacterium]